MTDGTNEANPVIISFASAPEGMAEDDFNEWFNTVHSRELVDHVDGILGVRRYKLALAIPPGAEEAIQPFVALYELDRSSGEVAANMGAAVQAGKLSDFDWKGRGPLVFFADHVASIS